MQIRYQSKSLSQKFKLNIYVFGFIFVLTTVLWPFQKSLGQSNILFYHTENFYNAADYNPSFLTNQKGLTINLFPLSGMGTSFNNHDAVFTAGKIVVEHDTDGQTKRIFRKLIEKDFFYSYSDLNLLKLGFNTPYGSFDFQIKEKAFSLMHCGNDLSRFLLDTVGVETIRLDEVQNLPGEGVHLREYSLCFAKEIIREKLDFGFRLKLYFGKAFFKSTVSGEMVEGDGAFYTQSHGDLFFSVPATEIKDNGTISELKILKGITIPEYVFNSENTGFGLDFGIRWKINPQLELSASILDLGGITWKKYLYQFNFENGRYKIENSHFDPEKDVLVKDPGESRLVNHLSAIYDIVATRENYKTNIPTTFYAGLNYKLSEDLDLGLVDRYLLVEDVGHNSFSALANYRCLKNLLIISGFGFYGESLKNIPLGIQFTWNAAQFYLGTDNMLSIFVPKFSDYSSLTFGVNFNLFSHKVRYKRVKELPFFRLKKNWKRSSDGLISSSIS